MTFKASTPIRPAPPRLRRGLGMLLFIFMMGGGVSHVIMTNAVATKGYEIRQLESRLEKLKIATRKLETEAAQRQSSAALDGAVPEGTYVAVERIEYLAPQAPQVGVAVR